tara:strand:- start:233 stop:481 length:249 start_codon:yes stop_codon:yes gene_type:complete
LHCLKLYVKSASFKGFILTIHVTVRDNNVEQALRSLKKKMQREGLYKEMKLRKHYEKPSLKKAREKEESIRRVRKLKRRNYE